MPDELYPLPFEALVVAERTSGADATYWIDDGGGPLVRYASSATALDREASELAESILPGRGTILSVSDPLFPRPGCASRGASRGFAGVGPVGPLSRLPGTAEETAALVEVFGAAASGGEVVALERDAATEPAVRRALPGKRYVHIGTHGIVNEHWNGLFASLMLTPNAAADPSSDDDGFLQLFEIYDLDLDADLVVLSACSTDVGPRAEGEGVFALSRAFSVAGARRVVATQWPVNDRATADLMRTFFGEIGEAERGGRRPQFTAALADAKRRLRGDPEFASPYFWAPFVLHGEG